MPRRARQLELPRTCTWGGARRGAGRKPPEYRAPVQHRRRIEHRAAFPVHITLRARPDLSSLRQQKIFTVIRRALTASSNARFRVLHFSVQDDHLHLIVEANDTQCAGSRRCGDQDPSGARDQSCACTSRSCLGGPLSRPLPAHAARGQSRPGLRPPELEKAPPEYAGPRRLLVRGLVRWVGGTARSTWWDQSGRGATNMARGDRLASMHRRSFAHRRGANAARAA